MTKFDYEIDDFMSYCNSKALATKTMKSYEQTLRLFARYLQENEEVTSTKEVTNEMIRRYIVYLKERGKYTIVVNDNTEEMNKPQNRPDFTKQVKNTTINNYIRNLKVYFNFMEDNYIMKVNPMQKTKFLKAQR